MIEPPLILRHGWMIRTILAGFCQRTMAFCIPLPTAFTQRDVTPGKKEERGVWYGHSWSKRKVSSTILSHGLTVGSVGFAQGLFRLSVTVSLLVFSVWYNLFSQIVNDCSDDRAGGTNLNQDIAQTLWIIPGQCCVWLISCNLQIQKCACSCAFVFHQQINIIWKIYWSKRSMWKSLDEVA